MSLFPCPDCDNKISFSAESCTDCGCVITEYHIKTYLDIFYYSEKEIMAKDYTYYEKVKDTCDHCQESHQRYIKANSDILAQKGEKKWKEERVLGKLVSGDEDFYVDFDDLKI